MSLLPDELHLQICSPPFQMLPQPFWLQTPMITRIFFMMLMRILIIKHLHLFNVLSFNAFERNSLLPFTGEYLNNLNADRDVFMVAFAYIRRSLELFAPLCVAEQQQQQQLCIEQARRNNDSLRIDFRRFGLLSVEEKEYLIGWIQSYGIMGDDGFAKENEEKSLVPKGNHAFESPSVAAIEPKVKISQTLNANSFAQSTITNDEINSSDLRFTSQIIQQTKHLSPLDSCKLRQLLIKAWQLRLSIPKSRQTWRKQQILGKKIGFPGSNDVFYMEAGSVMRRVLGTLLGTVLMAVFLGIAVWIRFGQLGDEWLLEEEEEDGGGGGRQSQLKKLQHELNVAADFIDFGENGSGMKC